MPTDLPAGPNSPPTDELDCAEASLGVLQNVLHPIADDDLSKQTPCQEFNIATLTDHLMNSITVIGGAGFCTGSVGLTAANSAVSAAGLDIG